MPDALPAAVVEAAARVIEILNRVVAEEGRSDAERLEISTATLDLLIAIEPSTTQMLEPLVPAAIKAWRDLDPEGWKARVEAMSPEEADFFHKLLSEHDSGPEQNDVE